MIRKQLYLIFLLLVSVQLALAQKYEYWLDNNYTSRTVVTTTSADVSLNVDLTGKLPGVHFFNVRLQDTGTTEWGGLYRYLFFVGGNANAASGTMSQYEYWLDNNYASRTTVAGSTINTPLSINVSSLLPGIHFFNYRAKNDNGELGGLYRYLFFVGGNNNATTTMSQYEYWLDNNYANRTTVVGTSIDAPLSVDISSLLPGVHFFNYRTKDNLGQIGGLYRYLFFVGGKGDSGTSMGKYDYWLDNDYANRKTVDSTTINSPLKINVSSLPMGIHFFNFQPKDTNGQFGGLYRYLFFKRANEASSIGRLSKVEMWIDDDRSNVTSQEVSNDTITAAINITDLPKGDHTLHVYGYTETGEHYVFDGFAFNAPHLPVVPTPVVTHNGDTIKIANGKDADTKYAIEYHYTLDGTTPTSKSTKYDKAFVVTRNDTLRVIGVQYAHENSEVSQLVIDWFKVVAPTGSQKGNKFSMNCATSGATIYYKIGDGEEQAYSSEIRLPDQLVVTAVGRREGYKDSELMIFQPRQVKSAKPAATYDGHYLRISSAEEGVNIYYTLNGSSPANGLDVASTAASYEGRMTIDTLCTLKAVAITDSLNVSDVLTYDIDYVYNGKTAYVRKPGNLSKAFEWYGGTDNVEELSVEGTLNNDDISALSEMPVLTHLDMENAKMSSGQLPADGFAGARMITYVSPKELTSAGGRLFADCPRLAAVVWNADVALKDNSFEGVDNPNLLLYVKKSAYKPSGMTNVVVNGTAENIVLKDSVSGNTNFYCPQPFTATNISYTHEYKQQTAIGVTQGWETLALPFTVETITHETHGALLPFGGEGEGKPFWLMKLGEDGLKYVSTIEANQPYVLSMPNNPKVYAEEYNQNGKVTFAAKDADVPVTDPQDNSGVGMTLRPVYQQVGKSNGVYALNVGEAVDDNPEGSVFKRDYRDVRPFEVYLLHSDNASRVIALSRLGGGNGTTGIDDMLLRKDQNPDGNVRVYSLSGTLIKQGKRSEVIKNLPKGIYIVDNKKMVIK